jgi:hypothetical protein
MIEHETFEVQVTKKSNRGILMGKEVKQTGTQDSETWGKTKRLTKLEGCHKYGDACIVHLTHIFMHSWILWTLLSFRTPLDAIENSSCTLCGLQALTYRTGAVRHTCWSRFGLKKSL